MKICLITGEYPPMQGGVADYTRELASALRELDVEVSILTSTKAGGTHGVARGSSALSGAADADPWPVYPIVEKWNFRSWSQILDHLHLTQPDIVHIQYQTAAYAMHPAINLLPLRLKRQRDRLPVVTTLHDLGVPYLFPKAGRIRHKVTLALLHGSDRAIVTNEEDWIGACALSHSGSPDTQVSEVSDSPNIRLVPIGSNIPMNPPDDFDRSVWRARWGLPKDHVLLSYFGLLNQSKGVETLLESLRGLADGDTRAKLMMVGAEAGDSDPTNIIYRRRILRQVAELGLDEFIIWTGYSTPRDVSAHLLSSDICVLPFRDGVSFRRGSLHAALAHGLPVVSTRGPELKRHPPAVDIARIVDRENAVLVAPDDAIELRLALEGLIQDGELRIRLSQGAFRLAEEFSWPSIARKTLSIYEEILGD